MKKAAVLSLFVMLSSFAFSQAKVEVGLKGGLNLASISSDQKNIDLSNKTGYHFGAYGLVKVLFIGVQPELLYSTKGTNVKVQTVAGSFSQDYTYLDIPVMIKFYGPLGLNVQAGPQFGMLLSTSGENPDGSKVSKSDFKDSDVSAAFGVGWDAPFGLRLNARYILGLSDISVAGGDKNKMFQLSIGYKLFGVGK